MTNAAADPILQIINEKLASLGTDFAVAADLPRLWVTAAQAFVRPDNTMIVFREQNAIAQPDGSTAASVKNVASIIIPTPILREFHSALGDSLKAVEASGG